MFLDINNLRIFSLPFIPTGRVCKVRKQEPSRKKAVLFGCVKKKIKICKMMYGIIFYFKQKEKIN